MKTPTPDEVMESIKQFYGLNGFAPTYRELARELNTSIHTAHVRVTELVKQGRVAHLKGGHRGMRPITPSAELASKVVAFVMAMEDGDVPEVAADKAELRLETGRQLAIELRG